MHYIGPDYIIEWPGNNEPVSINASPGDSVRFKVSISVMGGAYQTEGIHFLLDNEEPPINLDLLVFNGHYDPFPIQISSRPSSPSQRFTLMIPDDPTLIGQTLSGRISGNLKSPVITDPGVFMEENGTYEVTSSSVNVQVNITVTDKNNGISLEDLYLPPTGAFILFILSLPALTISRRIRRQN